MEVLHVVVLYAVTLLAAVPYGIGSPIMKLERAAHANNQNSGMSELLARDQARMSHKYGVEFPLEGSYDPDLSGIYYTKVHIGSPPREFYVQVDSGSEVAWISCSTCTSCPTVTGLPIQLSFFDREGSSTASFITCSDERCEIARESSDSSCSAPINKCSYVIRYVDGQMTSGFYLSDIFHVEKIVSNTSTKNASAAIFFGCSTTRKRAPGVANIVDGIFGFGQSSLSIISQLSREGMTPNKFAHCLRGDKMGGGILLLGEVVEPNIVYTPLVPTKPHYSIGLLSIAVNSRLLDIDPSAFTNSENKGVVVDSGTLYAYFPEEAYNILIPAITDALPKSALSFIFGNIRCYTSTSRDVFPRVIFNFVGGASLILYPKDYLVQEILFDGSTRWCLGFYKSLDKKTTILGDTVLRDKIIVYDLEGQRLGWVNYNCSLPINVSRFHGGGQRSSTDRSITIRYGLLLISFMVIFMCTCN